MICTIAERHFANNLLGGKSNTIRPAMQKNLRLNMSNKSKTEITIETHRTFIVRRRPQLTPAWCAGCAAVVSFTSPEDAAQITGGSRRDIYRAIEAGQLHFIETTDRSLRVCLASLLPEASVTLAPQHLDLADGQPADETAIALPLTELMSKTVLETVHPDGSASRKKAWRLTREAFDMLLASLDADRERAAERYEMIRARLLKFFECRGCPQPEDLTDDTINRVTRRLYEGQQIWTAEPASYFYGVARNVLREYWASPEREFATLDALPPAHPYIDALKQQEIDSQRLHAERRLDWLVACLDQLPAESRALILDYYQGDHRERIRHRRQMAERLGIPPNALRIRVHRIRARLECLFTEQLRGSHAL
jgi:RNA polymerase sigma factor (sigma-70 family)